MLSLAAFLLLAVAHTWPLAEAPSHWSRIDGDGGLNTWAIAWVAHALLDDPLRLFDGNIFHPQPLTLAYSEAMIVQSLFAVPVVAAGGSAVLAYSVAVLAGFTLTGWAFCLLARRWTGSWAAGLVAGSLAAFNAYSLMNFAHLQFLHLEFVPLMLFALDRLIVSPRARDAAWLAAGFVLQALTSIYLMVFSVFALAFAVLSRIGEWVRSPRSLSLQLSAAAVISVVCLTPYLTPYWKVRTTMQYSRSADEATPASWRSYLSTGARVHYQSWSREIGGGSSTSVFPGIAALVLAGLALTDRQRRQDPRVRMIAAATVGCVAISFAPAAPFYALVHRALPLLQAIRAVDRTGQMALALLAVLAAFGVVALRDRWGKRRGWPAVAAVILIAVNAEALRAPIGYTRFEGVPEVYDVLKNEPAAVVAELPFPMPSQWFLNSQYMVNATRHWRPIVNGYSGFRPPSYTAAYEASRGFPSDASLIALHALGVTHVVVHSRAFNNGGIDSRHDPFGSHSVTLLARDEDVLIYRIGRRLAHQQDRTSGEMRKSGRTSDSMASMPRKVRRASGP